MFSEANDFILIGLQGIEKYSIQLHLFPTVILIRYLMEIIRKEIPESKNVSFRLYPNLIEGDSNSTDYYEYPKIS